ncbi:fibrinogen alpha chain [Cololabis saira]|uniref:fibrinogen alpha chain n=1 Tax=Cololabis saira TaxID=129043 RepID=UPI002AD48550|nr:fibrinogen alpha chain [Cololabis saira]
MLAMTHIYNSNRRIIINRYMSELKLVEHADGLVRNLTRLQKRSAALAQKIQELSGTAQNQIEELYRTEVDIDMKLRSCQGSCRWLLPFSVDHHSYKELHSDMTLVDKSLKQRSKASTPPTDIQRLKLQPYDVGVVPSTTYKTIPTVQRELLTQFEDIGQNQLELEELLEESIDVDKLNVVETE